MGLKATVKKLIGTKNQYRIKAMKGWIRYRKTRKNAGYQMKSTQWQEPVIFEETDRNLFFGYYDLQQIQGNKMLLTSLPRKADPRRDEAELLWVDLDTHRRHLIGTTRAWCWQQGSRLRWHPAKADTVLYNDLEENRYVCREYSLSTGQTRTLGPAVYDITPDGRWGLTLHYSRLQRLRPGYGYCTLPDHTRNANVPEDGAIFLVDMESGTQKPLLTYAQLLELSPEAQGQQNYVNHISISPDGSRFLFFHLWAPGPLQRWSGRLCTANMDGSDLTCHEREFIPSHYCWKDSHTLLITSVGFGGSPSWYYCYDLTTGTRKKLQNDNLKQDGHPTFFPHTDTFLTDTYPLEGSMQHLFTADLEGNFSPICKIYSDPRRFEQTRCDLHPRLTPDGRTVTVDCTFRDGKRSVLLLRRAD
jgi:hypothetical protein